MCSSSVIVVRLGHRVKRDERATTHVCLTARALGASRAVVCGEKDDGVLDSVRRITSKWGGEFPLEYLPTPMAFLKKIKKTHKIIHLTMYGLQVQDAMADIRKAAAGKTEDGTPVEGICIVVGSSKVPIEIYRLADFNISVTTQPHSEIAALAVFLDRYFEGAELLKQFKGEIEIVPIACGKKFAKK